MTGMFRIARISLVVLTAVVFLSFENVEAKQDEFGGHEMPSVLQMALWDDVSPETSSVPVPAKTESNTTNNEPIPFSVSTMANDFVPPFAAHPELMPAKSPEKVDVSFEENMPVKQKATSIDDCCKELTTMIAGNIESDISLEAKTMMIETAFKMVARNIALKAEAKIVKLEAEHALELAQMQSQMMQMRSMGSAADQINRVAGPLSQMLQRNYKQSLEIDAANQQMSQTLAQLGYQKLEKDARIAKENRQRIQLTSPNRSTPESDYQWRISQLTQQVAQLQKQLEAQSRRVNSSNVQPAGYSQPLPLQPRRQPLEPLPSCTRCQSGECGHQSTPPLPYTGRNEDQYFQKGPELKLFREAAAVREARSNR